MAHPGSDQAVICWPCDEAAFNYGITLTESDLVQHVLLIGSTGSGKSTLLTAAARQLIRHQAGDPRQKCGLLGLDAKEDDLVARVREVATSAGRGGDVLVFGPRGDHALDPFGTLRSLDDVDRTTRRILLATDPVGRDNAFWQTSTSNMFSAAFSLWVASSQAADFASVVGFLRRWFLSPTTPPDVRGLADRLSQESRHPLLDAALDQVKLYQALESRTRSNLQSCLLNVLAPLASPSAVRCFAPGTRPAGSPASAARDGKLCVVAVNAMAEPELARFFFRLAIQDFFEAVQQRLGGGHRLCGILADEFPLVLTKDLADQLCTARSKRCFALSATQNLHSVSERVGIGLMRVLINNFNTTVFLRSREAETAVRAFLSLGTRQDRRPRRRREEGGWLGLISPTDAEPDTIDLPICPVGALGQLSPHEAYVALADGRRTERPVWFVPWFEEIQPANQTAPQAPPVFSAAHVHQLMQSAGFSLRWPAEVVMRACALRRRRRRKTMRLVSAFFVPQWSQLPEGLDELPDCWLAALPGILRLLRKPHGMRLPFLIDRVGVEDGVLLLRFAEEQPGSASTDSWGQIRVTVNSGLYPSRWRPLSRRHLAKLWQLHPELRPALAGPGPTIS
jgi:energy-coupling factor transporter ATP-binding protein EcfA2